MQLPDNKEVAIKLLSDNGVGLTEEELNFVLDYTEWKDFLPMIEKVIHFAVAFSWSYKFPVSIQRKKNLPFSNLVISHLSFLNLSEIKKHILFHKISLKLLSIAL